MTAMTKTAAAVLRFPLPSCPPYQVRLIGSARKMSAKTSFRPFLVLSVCARKTRIKPHNPLANYDSITVPS